MDSKLIHKAMKDRLPVIYEGKRYDRIAEYVAWYDEGQKLHLSAGLIIGNSLIRVDAAKVEMED